MVVGAGAAGGAVAVGTEKVAALVLVPVLVHGLDLDLDLCFLFLLELRTTRVIVDVDGRLPELWVLLAKVAARTTGREMMADWESSWRFGQLSRVPPLAILAGRVQLLGGPAVDCGHCKRNQKAPLQEDLDR